MRTQNEGFTLIELLIVIAIIGILSTIAIPKYAAYRTRAFDSVALSDLESAATAQDAYFVAKGTYAGADKLQDLADEEGFTPSSGVTLTIVKANKTGYMMEARHEKGSAIYKIQGPGGIPEKKTEETSG